MRFTSDEVRNTFHQMRTMLQVACQIFEELCADCGASVELLTVTNHLSSVILRVPMLPDDRIDGVVGELNSRFTSHLEYHVCSILDRDEKVFELVMPREITQVGH